MGATAKAVFILPSNTPAETVGAYFKRFPRLEHIVFSYDRPDEWDELDQPFDYYNVAAVRHLHWNLKMLGPVDAIVDGWSTSSAGHLANLSTLFYHLRQNGLYVIPWAFVTGDRSPLLDRADQVNRRLTNGPATGGESRTEAEFIRSVSAIRVDRREIRIAKRGDHLLKLRDAETSRVLPHRSPVRVDEIVTTKPGVLEFSKPVESSGAPRPDLDSVAYPPLHLRHYSGKIGLVSNSLIFTEHSVLPDSFRHHLEETLRNTRLTNVSQDFARVRPQYVPKEHRTGSYYLVDSENPGHFGHLMTEVIARLWGWDAAKAADPELKLLFRIRYTNERIPKLEQTLFRAYGIAPEDIAWTDRPVWLDDAWAATPQFHNKRPHYVHPAIAQTWRRIRDGLPTVEVPVFDKIFVSRGAALQARRCTNQTEVEARFRAAGFEIIYPEQYDLPEQAQIFQHARIIAGFGGSAMFNAIYADRLEHMIVLNQDAYTARNEHLIAMIHDVKLTYLWSPSRIAHPVGGWSREAYRSDWTFDFARNRDALHHLGI